MWNEEHADLSVSTIVTVISIVLQTGVSDFWPTAGYLTAYAADGHVLATADGLENALGLAVDQAHRTVYVYSPQRSEEPLQGTGARFVRWSGRFAVFDIDGLGPKGSDPSPQCG